MTKPVHPKIIGAIAGLSILITLLSAAQGQARDYTAERAIAAILGLAVVGTIIAKHSDGSPKAKPKERVVAPIAKAPTGVKPRPLPKDLRHTTRAQRRALPPRCLRETRTERGVAQYYGARCLSRHYDAVNRLPDRCERRIRTDRGVRYGWSARCLRREGYTLARR